MTVKTPVKATFTGSDVTGLAEYQAADFIGVADGGTGAVTFSAGILTADGTNAFTTVTAPSGTIVGTSDTITITESNISDLQSYILADSTDTLTNKTISGGTNTLSNIGNSSLTNSSITLGDDSISLGGTQTTVTNLSLDGATGTIDLTSSGNKIRFNYAGTGSFPSESTYEGMFAYDTTGNEAYVADAGGWVKLLNENSSVSAHADVNITGIADGYVLVWSSAQGRFNAGANSGSSFTTDKSNTGDGSTTAFTVVSGRTVDDVLVFVNGICLVPTDDYTISSTTLTFTTAPASSAELVFRYLG